MGYVQGMGLGTNSNGIADALHLQFNVLHSGIGLELQSKTRGPVWLDHADAGNLPEGWEKDQVVVAPRLGAICISKFCGFDEFQAMAAARSRFGEIVQANGPGSKRIQAYERGRPQLTRELLSLVKSSSSVLDSKGVVAGDFGCDQPFFAAQLLLSEPCVAKTVYGAREKEVKAVDPVLSPPHFVLLEPMISGAAPPSTFPSCCDIVFGDAVLGCGEIWSELNAAYKSLLVAQCHLGVRGLRKGGVLVLKVSDLFTRFSAGVVRILLDQFERVGLVKPEVIPSWVRGVFLVCVGLLEKDSAVAFWTALQAKLSVAEGQGLDLLEIMDNAVLVESTFLRSLRSFSGNLAKEEAAEIADLLRPVPS